MNLLFIENENGQQEVVEQNISEQEAATPEVTTGTEVADPTAPATPKHEPTFMEQYGMWVLILGMIAIMYFFMWRPESKRRKQMQQFRDGLKKGDKIITAGGIYGVIKEVHETSLLIEVDSNVTLRIDKNMVVGDPTQGVMQR